MAVLSSISSTSYRVNPNRFAESNFPIGAPPSLSVSDYDEGVIRHYRVHISNLIEMVTFTDKATHNMNILKDCTFCIYTTQAEMVYYFQCAREHLHTAIEYIDKAISSGSNSKLKFAAGELHEAAEDLQFAKNYLNAFHSNLKTKLSEHDENDYKYLETTIENLTRGYDKLPGADYLSQKLREFSSK